VLVWATATLLAAVLAVSGVSGVIGAAGSATGTASQVAAEAVGGDLDYFGTRLMGGEGGEAATAVLRRGLDGELSPEDRDYLAGLVAERTGQTPEEASAQVEAAMTEARELYDQAVEAAEQARVAAAIGGFLVAATLIAGAAAAYLAAAAGGDHRDRNLPFRTFGR
jgi:hypothetical protein